MFNKWIYAAASALALAILTLPRLPHLSVDAAAPDAAACDPKAKPARLEFSIKDMTGNDVKLLSFKGKVILFNFWATWCGPCKVEIPWFIEFQNKYGSQGLAVVGLSVDDPAEKVRSYAAQHKVNYPMLVGMDREDVQSAYGPIWGIPMTVIIGRDGKLCKKHMGITTKEVFEREIKALL